MDFKKLTISKTATKGFYYTRKVNKPQNEKIGKNYLLLTGNFPILTLFVLRQIKETSFISAYVSRW